jgi:APA family basic amino acid/polyamine antiporter
VDVLRTKPIEQSVADTEDPEHKLKKELTALDLAIFGVGVIIGTGIFVLTGVAAKDNAGPAVALSFVIAGIVCGLAALCYAEFASTVPVAGSAYTYSYATIGEIVAWIIGWDLLLEMALGAAVVSVGWSGYLSSLLDTMGVTLPGWVSGEGAWPNLPAVLIVLVLTAVVMLGIRISSRLNAIMVTIKLAVVFFVIVAGLFFVKGSNYTPFVPESQPAPNRPGWDSPVIDAVFGLAPSNFGVMGIFTAASIVFFAFIGFDVVATAAEETKNPQRDMPRGILGSLVICTTLYVLVCLVVVGMQNYADLNESAPLSEAFKAVDQDWAATLITIGALAGLTTVVMVLLLGQSRIIFAMSRDHLLPPALGAVHPKYGTPYRITIGVGVLCALMAGFISLNELAELVNIGTLFAFIVVSIAVVILRRTHPELPRGFRAPAVPLVPILSVLACIWLMLNLPLETWARFLVWMVIGFVIYFVYGATHSRVGRREGSTYAAADAAAARKRL